MFGRESVCVAENGKEYVYMECMDFKLMIGQEYKSLPTYWELLN